MDNCLLIIFLSVNILLCLVGIVELTIIVVKLISIHTELREINRKL